MRTVKKPSVTKKTCNPFDRRVVCQVGRRPRKDKKFGRLHEFRPMQNKAFTKLVDAEAWIFNSPTASGKSAVQKALAFVRAQAGEKCIIAVPEASIANSFRTKYEANGEVQGFVLPNHMIMDWVVPPHNFLFEDKASVTEKTITDRLIAFITKRASVGNNILVCTHAALVRVHKELLRRWLAAGRKGRVPWQGVNLYIDEAHHANMMDDATQAELAESNALGRLVQHYVEHRPGRIGLTTATWLRGDCRTIVPESCLEEFEHFEFPIDEFLDSMEHLREIEFKFTVGDYAEVLAKEFEASERKTIVYQPPIKAGEGSAKKLQYLAEYQKALAPFALNVVDLVTPEGRSGRRAAFEASQEDADVVIVQNTFREGADWPMAERSLVFGPRGSLPMVIQMLGRIIRDYPGKRHVEFNIVLPESVLADTSHFETYTSAIFMVMALGWQFTVGLKIPAAMRSPAGIKAAIDTLKDASIRGTTKDAGEEARGAIENIKKVLGVQASERETEQAATSLLDCMKRAFHLAAEASKNLTPKAREALHKAIESDPLKAAHSVYGAQWGVEEFKALRDSYVGLPEVTPEYMDRLLILNRCKHFQEKGRYVDPRTIPGIVKYFGSKKALDEACRAEGL